MFKLLIVLKIIFLFFFKTNVFCFYLNLLSTNYSLYNFYSYSILIDIPFSYKNKINNNLLNNYSFIHPVLLYIYISSIINTFFFKKQSICYKNYYILIISFIASIH